MPYLPPVTRPRGLVRRWAFRYSRRRFGRVVEPLTVAAHSTGVLLAMGAVEEVAARRWRALDPHLRWLAVQSAAGAVGCSWCTDFGWWEGLHEGVDAAKVVAVPAWRDSDVFDDRERAVLEFAEAASATPAAVDAATVERLRAMLGDEAVVELAAWVALEHLRSRFNAATGAVSEGFSDTCEVRPATAVARAGA